MSTFPVPEDVKQLLYETIRTYEQLEALVLLHGAPDAGWNAQRIADALRIPDDAAAEMLHAMSLAGLIESAQCADPAAPTYRVAAGALGDIAARLVQAYDDNRLEVIRLMNANAIHRMRTDAMRAFADAFLFSKDGKDGKNG